MQEPTHLSSRCQKAWIEFRITNKLEQVDRLTNTESTNSEDRLHIASTSSRFCGRSTCNSPADAKIDRGY